MEHAATLTLPFEPAPRRRVHFKTRGASLGLTRGGTHDLVRQVEHGLSFKALESLGAESGLGVPHLASVLGIPERTLARRKASGRLSPEESERLLRLSIVFERAVELFAGDAARAIAWMARPNKALGYESPLVYSRTELGAREVENVIGRLEHGVFA
ncbi:MAG: type II RES/Xre toxin-antitoxin system antitoxin [Terriglobia bacterium]